MLSRALLHVRHQSSPSNSLSLLNLLLGPIDPGANGETVCCRKSDSLPTTAGHCRLCACLYRLAHTPSIAFRHFLQRKDVVNQCLEFGIILVCQTQSAAHVREAHKPPIHSLPPTEGSTGAALAPGNHAYRKALGLQRPAADSHTGLSLEV